MAWPSPARHDRSRHFCPHHRDIAGVIARRLFLLVRRILLLVDNDERQIADRREHRRPRPADHPRLAATYAMPLLRPLRIRQPRMQDGDLVAEHLMQIGRHRRSQPNFRNQQDRRPARSSTCRMQARYTAVFPDPVMPCSSRPPNLRDATASLIFASASFCAALNSNSNGDCRGLAWKAVKSCGSSTSSINPRRTRVPRVVRGTSSPRKASTGKRPPDAASVSIQCRWFSLSFFRIVQAVPVVGTGARPPAEAKPPPAPLPQQHRDLHQTRRIPRRRHILARNPFLSHHARSAALSIPAPCRANSLRARSPAPPDNRAREIQPVAVPESASTAPGTQTSPPDAAPSAPHR